MSHTRQGYTSKDTHWIEEQDEETGSHSKQSYQSSSRSQGNRTSVTSSQEYPPNDDSPMNQQQSSTKISTSEQCTSKNDSLPNNQNIRHSSHQQLSARPTFPRQQPQKEHLLPSDRVHAPPKDDYPQSHSQSSSESKQQSSPVSTVSLKNKPQITYQSHQQPSLVTASSPSPSPKRFPSKDDHLASSRNSKHLKKQQPSDYSIDEPHKQVQHPKHSTAPKAELDKRSPVQQEPEDDRVPHKSQSTSINDPSAQRHVAPPKQQSSPVSTASLKDKPQITDQSYLQPSVVTASSPFPSLPTKAEKLASSNQLGKQSPERGNRWEKIQQQVSGDQPPRHSETVSPEHLTRKDDDSIKTSPEPKREKTRSFKEWEEPAQSKAVRFKKNHSDGHARPPHAQPVLDEHPPPRPPTSNSPSKVEPPPEKGCCDRCSIL